MKEDVRDVLSIFRQYSTQLDQKNDKYERLVKISRDITMESKRIIFLLHRYNSLTKEEKILQEAELRLQKLINDKWKTLALEIEDEDPYMFGRAFTSGAQEFVEAMTFNCFLRTSSLLTRDELMAKFDFTLKNKTTETGQISDQTNDSQIKKEDRCPTKFQLFWSDYILGLGDLGGEVMRWGMQQIGFGSYKSCRTSTRLLQDVYIGFLKTNAVTMNRDYYFKIRAWRDSTLKLEKACYLLKVREMECPYVDFRQLLKSIQLMDKDNEQQRSWEQECDF